MKRNPQLRAKLFSVHGFPLLALRNALCYFNVETLAQLESKVDAEEIDRVSFSRLKGGGNKNSPGILIQYLFNAPSGKELKAARVEMQWCHGEGI